MPTIEENRAAWGGTYEWSHAGEEWSEQWGSAHMQWFGSILPRIASFVPTARILEIAPGYGRWTAFLKDLCTQLTVVDLSAPCIERCRERFAHESHIRYFVNDGMSLDAVEDNSIDFIFSFDSLVHAEDSVLNAYAAEFAKKLRRDGVAFIHHSNLGNYARRAAVQDSLSKVPKLVGGLNWLGVWDNVSCFWRARTMTAATMAIFAEEHNLRCISQELVNWNTKSALIDCFSTIARNGSKWSRPNRVLRNPGFMREASYLRNLASFYDQVPASTTNGGPRG